MIDPLVDGALDNTLGQSGYRWFEEPDDPLLDDNAERAFRDFVDAYVYVPRRHVPLPRDIRTELNVHEPFIALWQDGATPVSFAAAEEGNVARGTLWSQFQESVKEQTASWSRWTRFQWTPDIVPAFKARVPDWEVQFSQALEEIRPAASGLSCSTSDPIRRFVIQLETDLAAVPVDRGYADFARKKGLSFAVVASAYAWNWFLRGSSYRGRTHGMSVRFHDLRDGAVVSPDDGTSGRETLAKPIPWGRILAQCTREKLIERDSGLFCDALRMVRDTVQTDSEYEELVGRAKDAKSYEAKQDTLKRAIARALVRADVPPPFSETTWRSRVIGALAKSAAEATTSGSGASFSGLLYEIVDLGLNSKLARRAEYSLRARLQKAGLWKVFRIPGRG